MKIDWNNAPEWAQYHAFDSDGRGAWLQNEPEEGAMFWIARGAKWPSGYQKPKTISWKNSLVKRPE